MRFPLRIRPLSGYLSPLTNRQKLAVAFGVVLLIVSSAAVTWTFIADTPDSLPGYSLENAVVFRFERALAVSAAFAIFGAFSARLIAGDLPSGITTRGVEWKGEEAIPAALEKTAAALNTVTAAQQETEANVGVLTEASQAYGEAIQLLVQSLEALRPRPEQIVAALEKVAAAQQETEARVGALKDASQAHGEAILLLAKGLDALRPLPEQIAALVDLSAK